MRALVFLLVLANLLFFVFARGFLGGGSNPDGERLKQQLQPERIVIVSKGEPAPEAGSKPAEATASPAAKEDAAASQGAAETSAPAAVAASQTAEKKSAEKKPEERKVEEKKPQACLAWPDLPVADADRLAALAKKKYPGLSLSRSTVSSEGGSNWVFIPPLASKADAERKAGELKKLGVTEFFIVTESGANQYAISLGLFSSEQGARDLLESLKAKGVRSAKVGQRGGKATGVHLEARGDAIDIQGLKDSGTAITATPAACEARAVKKP